MSVFIVGPPRSGTTLLAHMLDGHSQVAVMIESHLFGVYRKLAEQLGDRFTDNAAALLQRMVRSRPLSYIRPPIDVEAVGAGPFANYAQLAEAVLESWAAQRGKPIWAEKTPVHTLHWRYLRDAYPAARFVAIIRDPRPTAASLASARFGPSSVSEATRRWLAYLEAIDELMRAAPNNALLLRYETLVTEPQAALEQVCAFLSLDFEPQLLSPQPSSKVMTDAVNRQHLERGTILADTERWRDKMPDYQQRIVASIARRGQRHYHFEPDKSSLRLSDRLLDCRDRLMLLRKKISDRQGHGERLDQAQILLWTKMKH